MTADRLREELRAESESLQIENTRGAALRDIGLTIGSSLDLHDVFEEFSELTRLMIPFEYMNIVSLTYDESGFWNRFVVGNVESRAPLGVNTSIAGFVVRNHKSFIDNLHDQSAIDDLLGRFPDAKFDVSRGFKSILSVPLIAGNNVRGVLHFRHTEAGTFTEVHVDLAEQIATYVAPAVVNADLHANIQQESDIQEVLAELSRVMNSTAKIDDILEKIGGLMNSVVPTDRLVISLSDDLSENGVDSYVYGVEVPEWGDNSGGLERDLWAERTITGRAVTVTPTDDIDAATPATYHSLYLARQAGLRSAMYAPLIADGNVIGTINIKSTWPQAYQEHEKRVFGQIAQQLAGSIAVSEFSAAVEIEAREQEVLAELSRLLSSTVVISNILEEIGALMNNLVPTDRFVISLFDESTGRARDNYVYGVAVPGRDGVSDDLPRGDESSSVALSRSVIVTPTDRITSAKLTDDRGDFFTMKAGLRSAMYAPLIVGGKLIGTLNVKSKLPGAYQEREKRVFEKIAQQMTGSIALSESRAALEAEAKEQEILAEIGRLMSSNVVLDEVIEEFDALLNDVIPHDRMVLAFVEDENRYLYDRYILGVAIPGWDENPRKKFGQFRRELHPESRAATIQNSADAMTEFQPSVSQLVDKAGLKTGMHAPIVLNNLLIGTISIKSREAGVFTEHSGELFEKIAQQISGSIGASKLSRTLQQEADEQEKLAEIGRLMSSSVVLEEVFDEFAELMKNLIPHDRIVLALPDAEHRYVVDKFVRGTTMVNWDENPRHGYELFTRFIDADEWTASSIDLTDSQYESLPNIKEVVAAGLRSAVTGPLIAGSKLIGSIALKSKRADAFDSHYVQLLERVCQQVSGAIAASELSQSLQKEALEQEKLAEVGRVINSSKPLDEMWEELAPVLSELVDSDRITLAYKHEANSNFISMLRYGVEIPNLNLIRTDQTYPEIWNSSLKPFILEDSEFVVTVEAIAAEHNARSIGLVSTLVAQVKQGNDIVAIVAFRSTQENAYTQADLDLANKITNQIAGSIAKVQAFQALEDESRTREILSELGRILTLSLDLNDIFDQVGEQVQQLIPLDRMTLTSISDNGPLLSLNHVYGQEIESHPKNWAVPIPPAAYSLFRDLRDSILIDDRVTTEYPWIGRITEVSREAGLPSFIISPIIWQGKVIGLLGFNSASADKYSESDLQMAELVANRIAGSVASSAAYQAARQENEVRKALTSLSMMASRDLNLKNVGERVADGLRSLVPFDRFTIVSYDASTLEGTLEYFDGVELPGDEIGMGVGRYKYPRDWAHDEFEEIESPNKVRDDLLVTMGLNSWITKPLGTENSVPIGFISIRSLTPDFYTDEHRELFRQVALQITPAIQNAKVHEQSVQLAHQREHSFALDQENKELQRIADSRSEFLSTVSHELRTPLTAISAFADILHRNGPGNLMPRQLEQLEIVRRSSTNLAELIDDLLDVSRADSGRLQIEYREFNFTETVNQFRVGTITYIHSKNQILDIRMPDAEIWLNADKSRLLQILNNLSANASKYSPEGSVIKIEIEVDGNQLNVIFEDQGIGISETDLKRVFTPFFRADNLETRQQVGTGLGLTVVKSLVGLHKGGLKLESELGVGTRVEITLPCVIPRPEDPGELPAG